MDFGVCGTVSYFQTTKAFNDFWLVVSTPLKNISQLGLLSPIYGKNMFQTTNQTYAFKVCFCG